jgi:hypothetical protein
MAGRPPDQSVAAIVVAATRAVEGARQSPVARFPLPEPAAQDYNRTGSADRP